MRFTYKKLAQFFSYKVLLAFIILFFTAIPAMLMFFSAKNRITNVITNEYISDYINAIDKKTNENISSLIYQINSLSYYFLTNQSVYNTLIQGDDNYEESYNSLKNSFEGFLKSNTFLDGICLISPNKTVYNFSRIETDPTYLDDTILSSIHNSSLYLFDNIIEKDGNYYIPAAKKMYNYFTGSEGGYIIMYLNEDIFSRMYADFQFDDSSYFILLNNTIISHPNKSLINSKYYLGDAFFENNDMSVVINDTHLVSKKKINTNGVMADIEIVCLSSFKSFNTLARKLNQRIILLLTASILISIILSLVISSRLLSEIEILRKNMSEFGDRPDKYKTGFRLNEIKALERDFENMTHRITMLIKNISDEKEKQRIAELSALQAQINPHFIYNTLDSVAWLAILEKNPKIYNIIVALSHFFRISLNSGKNEIRIREEVEHVKNYLIIEGIRFPDKFTCEYDIDESLLELPITKIILQPLVENSIKHGFDGIDTGGIIKIKAHRLDNNYIEFIVSDNGCGMDFDPLSNCKKSTDTIGGYGIENVNARIKLAYGNECGLFYESSPQNGTTVRIKLKNKPKSKNGGNNEHF